MVDGRHSTRRAVKEGQASLVSKADADAATSPPRIKNAKPRQARKVSTAAGVSKPAKQNRKVSEAAKKIASAAHDNAPPLPTKDIGAEWCVDLGRNVRRNDTAHDITMADAKELDAESTPAHVVPPTPVREHLSAEEVESIRARVKDELAAARISPVRHDFALAKSSSSLSLPRPVHPDPPPPGTAPVSPYLRAIGRTPSPQPPPGLTNIPQMPALSREDTFQPLDAPAPAPPPNTARQESMNTDQDDFASLFEEEPSSSYPAATAPQPSQLPTATAPPTRPSLALPKLSPQPEVSGYAPSVLGVNKPNTYINLPGLGANVPPSWSFSPLNSATLQNDTSPTDPAFKPVTTGEDDDKAEEPAEPEDDRSHVAIDGHSEQNSMAITWGDEDDEHVDSASKQGKHYSAEPSPTIVDEIAALVNRPGPEASGSLRSPETRGDEDREHDDCGSPIIYSDEDDDHKESKTAYDPAYDPASISPYNPHSLL